MAIVGALVLPRGTVGITEASTTRSPSTPRTRSSVSTTPASRLRVELRIAAHRAGADRVVDRRHIVAHEVTELSVAASARCRLALHILRIGRTVGDLPHQADGLDQGVQVGLVGQVAGVDQRLVPGIGAAQRDPAAAAHVDERDQHGHAAVGRVGEAAVAERHGQRVPLDVRRGQASLAPDEPAGLRDVGRHRPGVGELPAEQVLRPGQLGQAA